MSHLAKLIGLAAITVAFAAPQAAYAATAMSNLVDGSVTAGSTTCTWADASTSDNPPNTLTVDHSTVSLSCNDSTGVVLNNSPVVSFDDAAGTATADAIDITATRSGVSCRYKATNVTMNRSGDTRDYSGGPYTAEKVSGSFFCPATYTIDNASVSFH